MLGAGPAGLAAGIYGARSRLRVGLVTKGPIGGQAVTTAELENYPGFGRGSTGPQVIEALMKHAQEMGAEFIFDEIESVEVDDEFKLLRGRKGEYRASALILAPGANPRLLGVPGEKELWGRGVSYCATCDAELYEDRRVAVVGSGDAAIEEALYLTRFASRVNVLVLHDRGHVDANPAAYEKAQGNPRISWVWNCQVERIIGRERVEGIAFKDLKSGQTHELPVDGVFVFIGTLPQTGMLKGLIDLDENGYIITDDRMRTSQPGVYAAGDARSKY
ncbi:MAG: FAD-dependent oxidoreductase, partial [Syntrophomonadaceae bacterium]|nr:FAD-dependent oxidoreductase [Syntrophomonadaceae bacterium]